MLAILARLLPSIFGGVISGPLGWIKVAFKLLPFIVLASALIWAGFQLVAWQTSKLETKLAAEKAVNVVLTDANTNLAETGAKNEASGSVTVASITASKDATVKFEKSAAKREVSVATKITKINKDIDSLPERTPESEKERADKVSTVQIDSLWASYCEAAPSATQCVKAPTS